jgi:hypothetical protein
MIRLSPAYIVNSIRAARTAEAKQAVAQLLKLHCASHAQEIFSTRLPEEYRRITSALTDAGLPD